MALPAKLRISQVRRRAREKLADARTQTVTGGVIAAVAYPIVEEKLPATIGPVPTRLALAAAAAWYGMREGHDGAIGAALVLAAPTLENLARNAENLVTGD